MLTFEQVKQELATRVSSVRHFTRAFYQLYLSCLEKTRYNAENDIDDSFMLSENVRGYKSWEPVYNSLFYQKNSAAYCEFLSVVYGRV